MINKGIIAGVFMLLLIGGVPFSANAQTPQLTEVQKGVADLSSDLARALPFNSSLGLNWSDAYIGKLFPSAPPHFGVGIALGATTMELSSVESLADLLGADDFSLPLKRMPIPGYTAEARIGGFFLPFDVGFKFGYLPPLGLADLNLNYMLVGADIRYAILDGKSNRVLPNISLGFGINYLNGGVGANMGEEQEINAFQNTIRLFQPEVGFRWSTVAMDLKAQVSKSLFLVTPYLGFGGTYARSRAGYEIDARVTYNGEEITQADIDEINDWLSDLDLEEIDVSIDGISSIVRHSDFNFRVFGGLSFNFLVFRLDLTGLYNFLDNNYGANLGIRFQL